MGRSEAIESARGRLALFGKRIPLHELERFRGGIIQVL
jgi:hypothetical protein